MDEKPVVLFILNTNEFSQIILKNFLRSGMRILLLVDNIEFYKDNFFDFWDKFESVISINEPSDTIVKSFEKYTNLHIISLVNLNEDDNSKSLGVVKLLQNIRYTKLIYVNQFLSDTPLRNGYAYNNIYKMYLNELAVTRRLKNYHIVRAGRVVYKDEAKRVFNATPIDSLISTLKSLIVYKPINFPYLTRYIIGLKARPLASNINLTYDDTLVTNDQLIIQYCKFPNINEMHRSGRNLIIYGFLFKFTCFVLHKCLRKL
jgi:hypothetical protein